ncbi:MAG: hypothetical protein OHK0018_15360 [Erythrobacter tepidarius]
MLRPFDVHLDHIKCPSSQHIPGQADLNGASFGSIGSGLAVTKDASASPPLYINLNCAALSPDRDIVKLEFLQLPTEQACPVMFEIEPQSWKYGRIHLYSDERFYIEPVMVKQHRESTIRGSEVRYAPRPHILRFD